MRDDEPRPVWMSLLVRRLCGRLGLDVGAQTVGTGCSLSLDLKRSR